MARFADAFGGDGAQIMDHVPVDLKGTYLDNGNVVIILKDRPKRRTRKALRKLFYPVWVVVLEGLIEELVEGERAFNERGEGEF